MKQVSERLRQLRLERNLSLRMLAKNAGISASALSQIEAGLVSPSIATLEKVCAALSLPVTSLFDEPENGDPLLMPARNRRRVYSTTSHATVEPLARGLSGKKMQPILITLDPGGEVGEQPYVGVKGEEFGIVVSGTVVFEQAGKKYDLGPMDAVYFDPHQPHNWKNADVTPATILIVVSL
ncbi:MAG: XRE family transcriptional regulator [Nitrospirae bacterium]|nr:XRE family transcriptional regulator [Nitrospirota bacterium]MCL5284487.1 XRE family transcriptional regulator [Nitrospirota bacterium]